MSADGIEQILMGLVVFATALLLLRMMMLKLHHPFPLFAVSIGLGIVFDTAYIIQNVLQLEITELFSLSLAIDFFLTPFVAIELYRVVRNEEEEAQSWRFVGPVAGALFAGGFVVSYFALNPEKDSRDLVANITFLLDTLMTFCVLGYLISRLRKGLPPAGRNVRWLRRLFLFTTAADALDSFVELNLNFAGVPDRPVHMAYIGFICAMTAACALALRKLETEGAPASDGPRP